jgi:acetyltransferase-like isoleucine patch superfamily enzyme
MIKKLFIVVSKQICGLFFDKKFLKGKMFDNSIVGWKWVYHSIIFQKILRFNSECDFPVSPLVSVSNSKNIIFHQDDLANFQSPGCYFQSMNAKIVIGKGTYIAPNVGLITADHDFNDLAKHKEGKNIVIGEKCWIGMNSVILKGVELGEKTIVGAGSVVTKSFPEGKCVIAGNPAKLIRKLS